MANLPHLIGRLQYHLRRHNADLRLKLTYPWRCLCFLRRYLNSFLLHLLYFVSLSGVGFVALKLLKTRTTETSPKGLDLFFTSVSAVTVSSMSTVEMEVFSNTQLLLLTVLMFMGGEVFTSMAGLHVKQHRLQKRILEDKVTDKIPELTFPNPDYIRYRSIRLLGFSVLAYLVGTLVLGTCLVLTYITMVPSAGHVLEQKGLKKLTFSVFTTVSTFVNCGFVPTNENMVIFRQNSGLLLILIPQVLMGNTLFPSCLRFCLWVYGKVTKREEVDYLLNTPESSYKHLLPKLYSFLLFVTVFGFIGVQFVVFCAMEWSSESLAGLDGVYEKIVGVLFMCVNSRQTGETVVDLSAISTAMIVVFVVMMYLPPYTSFFPVSPAADDSKVVESGRSIKLMENLILSQLSYLAIFIILVCITEREKMKQDPLNFSLLSVVVEVISAYGNVGFTMGYSCKRQLLPDSGCKDKWFGFSGKWSDEGKMVLILVMIFGRMKKFNMNGGKAWKLL